MHRMFWMALPVAMSASLTAHAAQPAAAPPSAADANASVPEARYDSAFNGYQRYREQQPATWREVNDDVHKAGGHIGIFGGTHGAKPASATPQPENKN